MPKKTAKVALLATIAGIVVASKLIVPRLGARDGAAALGSGAASAPLGATSRPSPRLCAALRGNGNYIMTHFASLARLMEHYGPFDGLAGGSSATITIFLYESMAMNPAVRRCGERVCEPHEVGRRLALLLKSIQGYAAMIATESDEAIAIRGLAPLVERVQADGIGALLESNPIEAATKLRTLLSSQDLRDLVNDDVLASLAPSTNLARNAREVYEAIISFGRFDANDPVVLFRPGVLSFPGLAAKIGRMGNFYAGYGPADAAGMGRFLDDCAPGGVGRAWSVVAADRPVGAERACGEAFAHLARRYRQRLIADESSIRSRVDDEVGASGAHSVVATSVLSPSGKARYDAAAARYLAGAPLDYAPVFDEVRYGLWAAADDTARLTATVDDHLDLKSRKSLALGRTSWRTALTSSPAEPGLASAQRLPSGLVTLGGWVDLHPVQVLRRIGCERVVYVTRQGEDSAFGRGIARQLGATPRDEQDLYDLDDERSSFSSALREASAVWCTDWDSFKDAEVLEMAAEAYSAPLETTDAFFKAPGPGLTVYETVIEGAGRRGCKR